MAAKSIKTCSCQNSQGLCPLVTKMKRLFQKRPARSVDQNLTVLITNITLSGRTGTEIVTRDLALGLRRRGHRPIVYTLFANGPIARELQNASIPVVTEIEKLAAPIDIIHGHHTPTSATAICKYPETPAIFVAHDFVAWHDVAPDFGSIRRVCAVDTTVAQRFTAYAGKPQSDVSVVLNAVDMKRFPSGSAISSKPERALAFAKNAGHLDAIKEACTSRSIKLDVVGAAVGKIIEAPEIVLPKYDLVFTSALSALEALACGRATIVCDGRGLAGMVTPENMQEWREKNFGLACLTQRVTKERVLAEIDKYDVPSTEAVSQFIRENADQETWLDTIEELYHSVIQEAKTTRSKTSYTEIAHYLETWSPRVNDRWPWLDERTKLVEDLASAKLALEAPAIGEKITLSSNSESSKARTAEGFSWLEKWGVWSNAETATILTRKPSVQSPVARSVEFEVQLYLPPQKPTLEVDVLVNGIWCTSWSFNADNQKSPITVSCPYSQTSESEHVWITFQIKDPRSPRECGSSDDPRKLGLGLISFCFKGAISGSAEVLDP
jgi:hypothetical protein